MLGLGKGMIFNLPLFSKVGLTQVESGLAQGLDGKGTDGLLALMVAVNAVVIIFSRWAKLNSAGPGGVEWEAGGVLYVSGWNDGAGARRDAGSEGRGVGMGMRLDWGGAGACLAGVVG